MGADLAERAIVTDLIKKELVDVKQNGRGRNGRCGNGKEALIAGLW